MESVGKLSNLRHLDLNDTSVTNDGLKRLSNLEKAKGEKAKGSEKAKGEKAKMYR
jgi:hypothetical protein